MAGICNLKGTFTSETAKLEVVESGGCTKPSLTMIFQRLFPDINLNEATEGFIISDQFELDELEVEKSSLEVTVQATAKDTLDYAQRKILVNDGKLTLGFSAGANTLVGIEFWRIKVEGEINFRLRV